MKGSKGPKGPPKGAGRGGGYTEVDDEDILEQFCLSRRSLTCSGPYRLAVHRGESEKGGEYHFCVQTGKLDAVNDDGRTLIGYFSSHACVESPITVDRSAEVPMPSVGVLSSEVMKEIQDPANAGAFVVLPSQFNGVEFPSHCSIVESVEDYKYDHTGGPCGQLAVHPGIAQFLLDNCSTDRRPGGIDATRRVVRKVNGLLREKGISSKKHMFSVVNGYLKMPVPDSNEVAETAISALAAALPALQLLLMRDALAAGLAPNKTEFCSQSHRVNLVYASAVPVNAYVNGIGAVAKDFGDAQTHEFQRQISELFLVAQYHGALRLASEAARSSGRRSKVLLMPLGGGAFKNSWESIVKSMALATELLGPADLDVQVLVLEGGRAGSDERPAELRVKELLQKHKKLREVDSKPETISCDEKSWCQWLRMRG